MPPICYKSDHFIYYIKLNIYIIDILVVLYEPFQLSDPKAQPEGTRSVGPKHVVDVRGSQQGEAAQREARSCDRREHPRAPIKGF